MKLSTKLLLVFLVVGIIPGLVIGLVLLNTSSESLSVQAFNQLETARSIKKVQMERYFEDTEHNMTSLVDTIGTLRKEALDKLIAVREVKHSAVERYFEFINNQIITFSEDIMVVDAMKDFCNDFANVREELAVTSDDIEKMRTELFSYYSNDFNNEYRKQNSGNASAIQNYFKKLDDDSIVLQHKYISSNPNSLGSKHLLSNAKDASA